MKAAGFGMIVVWILMLGLGMAAGTEETIPEPTFKGPIMNVTSAVGRETMLSCTVQDLGVYKVAWLRVGTQTILTIANHVITKNHRIGVTHSEHRTWYLHIKEVKESDRGFYMCQINTDPMKSQMGYLDVVVSPNIVDDQTSTDVVAKEGSNMSMRCSASGSPTPTITWRREGGHKIPLNDNRQVDVVTGNYFNITHVKREHMGPYLCIASNGVPPTVSKRIALVVQFPPAITVPSQLVAAPEGSEVTLECISEAYPKSINYWTRDNDEIVAQDGKFEPVLIEENYRVRMRLTIKSIGLSDYRSYKCRSRNSLGDADGIVKIYRMPGSSYYSRNENKGKNKKNTKYNIIGGNQDMLKDRDQKLQSRKDSLDGYIGDDEDYDYSGAESRFALSGGPSFRLTFVAVVLLVYSCFHLEVLRPA